jgi:bacillithiol synthase
VQSPTVPSSESALKLAVDVRRFPWVRRLAQDYAFDFARLAPHFGGDPTRPEAWAAAITRARAFDRPRAAIAEAVAAQQERRNAPVASRNAARRLAGPGAVAIVTGQQAGLFGGPLYTLLKAITALRLAERIAIEHQATVVAVFWIDSEDHDWDEIATCGVFDGDLERRAITAAPPAGAGEQAAAKLAFTGDVTRAIDELEALLPGTEFTPALLESLRTDYAPGRSVADAFARWLERALGPRGLVVYDAADPAAKPFAAALFRAELETPGRTSRLAAEAGAALVALGYHSQVVPQEDSVALFDLAGLRRPIHTAGDAFRIGEDLVARDVLLDRVKAHPEGFSPGVLLRPLVQDTIFPTVGYVAGPSELAYLAQLRAVYDSFGVPLPLIQPRATATILDSAGMRFLTRYQVPFESLEPQDERALNDLLTALLPPAVERAVQDAEAAIAARLEAVIGAVPAIDPTLEGAARSTLGKIEHDMKALRSKILQAAKRRDETLRRQFVRVRAQAFPGGEPQERSVGSISFLNRYGPALIDRLAAELPIEGGTHWIVTV